MKKLFSAIIISAMLLSLIGCFESIPAKESKSEETSTTTISDNPKPENTAKESKSEETSTTTVSDNPKPANTAKERQEETISYEITDNRIRTWTNSIGTTRMQGIVEITNTGNTNLYLSAGKFEIDDSAGNIVDVKDLISVYPQVIAPGEKAYYYEETNLDSDANGEYVIVPTIKAKKAKVPYIRYETSNFSLSDNDLLGQKIGLKALGKITNTDSKEESLPLIVVFLFDSDDKLTGLMSTYGDEIASGETSAEEIIEFSLPYDITSETVDHFEIVAYPFQYQF